MKLRARWFLALGLVGVAGCDDRKPCNVHLRDGESFTVEVLGKADPTLTERPWYIDEGLPSCGDLDPVEAGARFSIKLEEHDEGSCYAFVCPVDFPSAAEPTPTGIGRSGEISVCYNGASKLPVSSTCEVQRFVALHHGDIDSIYEQPDANGDSKVKLIRALMIVDDLECSTPPEAFPNAAERPKYFCYDQWNVQLTPAGK